MRTCLRPSFAALGFPFISEAALPTPEWSRIWLLVMLLALSVPRVNADEGNLTLTVSCSANGDVSPKGTLVLPKMSDITLTATPNAGYEIEDWYFNGVNAGSDTTSLYLPLGDIDVSVYVHFIRITNLVHAWAGTSGSLSPNSDNGPLGVAWGDSVNFTAQPDPHYHVDEWKVDDVLAHRGGTTFTLQNVTAEHWVEVTFAPDVYTVQATAGGYGSLSPTGSVSMAYGDSRSFTATPDAGCDVALWSLDGQIVQTNGTTFWLMNVQSNHVLQVTFAAPVLSISRTSTNTVVLSWPLAYADWTLQTTTNLSDTANGWTDIAPPYVTGASDCRYIQPLAAGAKFYRLYQE